MATSEVTGPLRITRLIETDFMGIHSLDIRPGAKRLIVLRGPNEQGKTSAIIGLVAALAGKRFDPAVPVRKGATTGKVVMVLADDVADRLRVKATWTPKTRTLTLTRFMDGAELMVPSPQSALDELVGAVAYDPLAFMRRKGPDRFRMLMQAIGKQDAYEEAMAESATWYEKRTEFNRQAKAIDAELRAAPDPSPGKELIEISDADLTTKLRAAEDHNADIRQEQAAIAVHAATSARFEDAVAQIDATIARLQRERATQAAAWEAHEATPPQLSGKEPIGVEALSAEVAKAHAHNAAVAKQRMARGKQDTLRTLTGQAENATGQITRLNAHVRDLVATSDIAQRVPGLSIADDGSDVLYQGRPVEQASGMQQLHLSALVGMAAEPKIRVMAIDEGDRLDTEALEELGRIAEANDYQVWMTAIYAGSANDTQHLVELLNGMEAEQGEHNDRPSV